jgi:hypothetical protein
MFDLGAALLACGLIAALSLEHDSGALELLRHMLRLALLLSPWLCLGLLLRAALLRLPLRRSLQAGSRGPEPVALGCSLALLGLHFAAAHLALGLLTVVLLQLGTGATDYAGNATTAHAPLPPFGAALERELVPLVGWLLLGLLGAAYVRAHVPALPDGGSLLTRLAWTAAIAALGCASPPAAVPLASALVTVGLPPAAALAGLLLGTGVPPLLGRARGMSAPPRGAAIGLLLLLLAGGALLAAPADVLLLSSLRVQPLGMASALSWLSLAALLGIVGRNIWQTGVRAWLVTSLGSSVWPAGSHGHEHASPGSG